jgi:mannose-6-phosphate isomerase-like protein (cupin superfamily)
MNKEDLIKKTDQLLQEKNLVAVKTDFTRPWGGFYVIDEQQADRFIELFFPGYKKEDLLLGNKLSPKILLVAPKQRLSWQYHHRRAEIWRVVEGEVGVVRSMDDTEKAVEHFGPGSIIVLEKGTRHRLVGLNDWGVLAEIWQHTDPDFPSDEEDIVRLQDDYGR